MLLADVNFATGMMLLEYDTTNDPRARAIAAVAGAGHGVEPLDADAPAVARASWWTTHRAEVTVAASGALILLGHLIDALGNERAAVAVFGLAIIVGGSIIWRRAATSIAARTLDMNVLMTIAVCGAAAIGEWSEGATVVVLFALGGALESRSVARTRRSIRDLVALAPERAHVLRNGVEADVAPADVEVGEVIVVRPGERLALDGIVMTGSSAFDESPITGESIPVDRTEGDRVFAGSLNTTGLVTVRSTAPAAETTLARIVHLVEVAQASRAPVQRFVDRFSRWYTPAVIVGAVLVAVAAPAIGQATGAWPGFEALDEWIYRALVLLVVSCPCALVVSTPVAIVSAITRATHDGVLIKGGAFLEAAGRASVVVFDKTGTLTRGKPVLERVVALGGESEERVRALGASLEAHSNHPVARAITAAGAPGATLPATDAREEPGRGVHGVVDGDALAVGGLAFALGSTPVPADVRVLADEMENDGLTVVALAREGGGGRRSLVGLMGIADEVRAESAGVVAELSAMGIERQVMLTGDNPHAASRVAATVGLTEYQAGLLPEDKAAAVSELRAGGAMVAMVGDGVNDAPALAAADIGIAMGAAGSDTAIEVADVALMHDHVTALPRFFALGRRTMRIIRQNVALSLGIKTAVLVLAVGGYATLWLAVFADTGVALIVIANGLRLLRSR